MPASSPRLTASTTARPHIPELDGVRGIAILLVLLVHFGDYAPTHDFPAAKIFRGIIGFGWTGVDLFFVLSGCLITGILLDAKGSPHYFRSFYARRALRILPLYYVAVAGYFLVFLPLSHSPSAAASFSAQWWFWTYLSNWKLAFTPDIAPPLGHFWTLAIEEQFYLVWPLAVYLFRDRTLRWMSWTLVLLAPLLRSLPAFQATETRFPEFLYNLTPFRWDSLALGALVALSVRGSSFRHPASRYIKPILLAGFLLTLAAVISGKTARYYSAPMTAYGYTGVDLACAGLVLAAVSPTHHHDRLARILRHPALRTLGKYSYGIYVIHWPVSYSLANFLQDHIPTGGGLLAACITLATGIPLSIGLALLSWNLLEKHFLRLKSRFPYTR